MVSCPSPWGERGLGRSLSSSSAPAGLCLSAPLFLYLFLPLSPSLGVPARALAWAHTHKHTKNLLVLEPFAGNLLSASASLGLFWAAASPETGCESHPTQEGFAKVSNASARYREPSVWIFRVAGLRSTGEGLFVARVQPVRPADSHGQTGRQRVNVGLMSELAWQAGIEMDPPLAAC